jgi:hypothetical protein
MECKICEKEREISKHFKHSPRLRICDECVELMGYNHQRIGERIYNQYKKNLDKSLKEEVQRTLPMIIEKLMTESDLTFELKVC